MSEIIFFSATKKSFFCRNDVQAIDFLRKGSYAPGGFMTDLCKQAKCSKIYTAHCLRTTAIQAMNDAGHELRHIMFMTGHKNEASIRRYNRHCSVQQKKSLGTTLSRVATREVVASSAMTLVRDSSVV